MFWGTDMIVIILVGHFKNWWNIMTHKYIYKPFKSSSVIRLPVVLNSRYCIINFKNSKDEMCLKQATLSHYIKEPHAE